MPRLLCLASMAGLLAAGAELQLQSHGPINYPPLARAARIQGTVLLEFTVSVDGTVTEPEVLSGHPLLSEAAKENLTSWRFAASPEHLPVSRQRVPFVFEFSNEFGEGYYNTAAETAEFTSNNLVRIRSGPNPSLFAQHCPSGFVGEIKEPIQPEDYVKLTRTPCFGTCPYYDVTVSASGQVAWTGRAFVKITGERQFQVPEAEAKTLIAMFRTAEVWSLCNDYSRSVTDNPSVVVEISTGGRRKTINDYANASPPWFRTLQRKIDEVSRSHDLRHGNAITEPADHITSEYLPKPGLTPLMEAAGRSDIDTVRKLVASGADVNAADASGWTALMYGAAGYSGAPVVDTLLKARADASLRDHERRQAFQFTTRSGRSKNEQRWVRRTLESATRQKKR